MSEQKKRKVYVCGRMRGVKWFNFPAFDAARDRLLRLGYDVVSPADIDRSEGFDAMTLPEDWDWNMLPPHLAIESIMARDIDALNSCDTIYLIRDGIETSEGAQKEIAYARKRNLPFLEDGASDEWLSRMAQLAPLADSQVSKNTPESEPRVCRCKAETPKPNEVRVKPFVITAYRWGLRDCHSYVVGVRDTLEAAKTLADEHVEYRGGKYGCEVVEGDTDYVGIDGSGGGTKSVYYHECPYFGAAGHGNTAQPVDASKPGWVYEHKESNT